MIVDAERIPILPTRLNRLPPMTRFMIGVLGIIMVLTLLAMGSEIIKDPRVFPVSNVDVLGTLDYTDRTALSAQVQDHFGKGLLALDIDQVRRDVESLGWVAAAHVRREWPARLTIAIEEHEPAARWNSDGLVSKRHEMFLPPQLNAESEQYMQWQEHFSNLPRLSGAAGRHDAVLDDYRHYEERLALIGLSIEALMEDDRRSQTLELSDGVIVKLGYENQRERLQNFIIVHDRLVTENTVGQSLRFDMRYKNGFAFTGRRPTPGVI